LRGAKKAIVHLYNSTSPIQRRIVFGMDKPEILGIAVRGAKLVKELVHSVPETQIIFQYSPESFSATEVDFALEICEAVVDVWQPTLDNKIILNLPDTVQYATPNVHADQIEWFCRHMRNRENAIISVHTHNDRGTGVAATELGLMAGAERVEGTLFGNGERTGNVDIVTVALNMYMQGIDPGLDFSNLAAIREVYEHCTRMEVPVRQPYAGELVFTAFSGSHQDAIKKGMDAQDPTPSAPWEVPYLPIDPGDLGRSYEAIIRINSQSGKGGVAYVLESEFGLHLPKIMHVEFGKVIKALADARGNELSSAQIHEAFAQEYLEQEGPLKLESFHCEELADGDGAVACVARLRIDGVLRELRAQGNGPIDAFVRALNQEDIVAFKVLSYAEHSLGQGAEAQAAAYIQIQMESEKSLFGAAIETNIELASVKAVLSALNRVL
jgi:2-isopropylmalate synthase